MTTQTIRVTDPAGAVEYTWATTITADHDIDADTVEVSMGSASEPGEWVAPTTDPPQADTTTRVVQLLVDDETEPGTYWLWVRLTDNPEIVPRRGHRIHII